MADARKHTLAERVAAAERLAPAERRVAEYFTSASEQVAFLPAAEIAATLGVSNATVVRTAQRLGYAGLPELKEELKGVVLQRWTPPTTRVERSLDELTPEADGFAEHSMRIRAHLIDEAGASLRDEDIHRAVQILGEATRVVVFGSPNFQGIAYYVAQGFRRFGRRTLLIGREQGQTPEELLDLNRDDAVLVLVYSRVIKTVEVVLDRAREQNAPCILVTDALSLALKGRYAVALTAPAGDPSRFPTATVPLAVVETLMLAVGKLDRARTRAALDKRDQLRAKLGHDPAGH